MRYIKLFENFKTDTNFKKWFGDSKIVENGEPLICYHGSNISDIKEFDIKRIGSNTGNYGHYGYGVYFSTDIREAKTYGKYVYKCYLKVLNPFTGTNEQLIKLKDKGVDIFMDVTPKSIDYESLKKCYINNKDVYNFLEDVEVNGLEKAWENIINVDVDKDLLNELSNIIDYTTLNKNVYEVPDFVIDDLKRLNIEPKINYDLPYTQSLHWITDLGKRSKEVTDVIKELGYDGVFYGSEIVIFEPTQIKSIDNDGSWDINDSNIYS